MTELTEIGSLTVPRSPIVIGGVEFSDWRQFADHSIMVRVGPSELGWITVELGRHVPGQAEDGSNVLWLISTINIVPEGAEVIVVAEIPLPEGPQRRVQLALPMEEGHVATEEMAKGLEGQWMTILLGGQAIMGQIVEAETVPDGRQVDVILDTPWPGLTLQIPAAE